MHPLKINYINIFYLLKHPNLMPKVTRKPLHTRYTKYVLIDHILEDEKSNNSIENLNPTTTKGNVQKSAKLNPGRYKGAGSIPIQGKKVGETEWVDYFSAIEAARILNICGPSINKVLKGRYKQTEGYVFRYKEDPDLEGEVWINNTHVGVLVSNMGRVKSTIKTKGTLCRKIYYRVYVNKKNYQVHRLVCQAFKWKLVQNKFVQQEEYKDIYSFWNSLHVDHIDTNPQNNHIDNLRPLTITEHHKVTNHNDNKGSKTRSIPIQGKKIGETVWVDYPSATEAGKILNIGRNISRVCRGKRKKTKGYVFRYKDDPDLEGEIWKDIPQKFFKGSVQGWRVSNKGRVHGKKGVKSWGTKHEQYRRFSTPDGHNIYVHRAVAAAFMKDKIMEVLRSIDK